MLEPRKQGDLISTQGGRLLSFVAFVPEAEPQSQIVMRDGTTFLTYWVDGVFATNREPCGLDLIL